MVSLGYFKKNLIIYYVSKRGELHEAIQRKSDTGAGVFPTL